MEIQTELPLVELLIRLGIASLLGMTLGLERELSRKPAGLRTNTLVALGAATTTIVAFELFGTLAQREDVTIMGDPIRAVEGVVGALGFLGAGAIIQSRGSVHGLTTAANIWLCGAIGMACGGGYYIVAVVAFAFTLVTLTVLKVVERILDRALFEQ